MDANNLTIIAQHNQWPPDLKSNANIVFHFYC